MPDSVPDPNASNATAVTDTRATRLAALRARIRRLERGGGGPAGVLPLGPAAIDSALPGGGLPLACLHEVTVGALDDAPHDAPHEAPIPGPAGMPDRGSSGRAGTANRNAPRPVGAGGGAGALAGGAAAGFAATVAARLAARCGRPVLWLMRDGDLYPPGLVRYGLVPERLILARAARRTDRLWALEEAARSGALAAVVGEAAAAGPSESRRLQLAAEAGGVTILLLDRDGDAGRGDAGRGGAGRGGAGRGGRRTAGTAVTRWRVAAAGGVPDGPGVGTERWRLELVRVRGGLPGAWLVAWLPFGAGAATADADPAGPARPETLGELALAAAADGAVPEPRRRIFA